MGDFARGFTKSYDSSSIIKGIQARDEREEAEKKLKKKLDDASKIGKALSGTDIEGAKIAGGLMQEGAMTDLSDAVSFMKLLKDDKSDVQAIMDNLPEVIAAFKGDGSSLDKVIKDRKQEDILGGGVDTGGLIPKGGLTGVFEDTPAKKSLKVGPLTLTSGKTGKERSLDIQQKIAGEVGAKKAKDILTTSQDLINAELKIDNTMDSWLDMVDRTQQLTGAKAGIIGGSITAVLGKAKANEFYEGFKGGLTEYAAAVGRISIPGARATRLIGLFKGTAPGTFSSIPSAIQTSADSFRNALSTDMSRNPKEYYAGYRGREDNDILKEQLREFEEMYKEGLYKRAFDKNPLLVPKKYREKFGGDAVILERLGVDPSKYEIVGVE